MFIEVQRWNNRKDKKKTFDKPFAIVKSHVSNDTFNDNNAEYYGNSILFFLPNIFLLARRQWNLKTHFNKLSKSWRADIWINNLVYSSSREKQLHWTERAKNQFITQACVQ